MSEPLLGILAIYMNAKRQFEELAYFRQLAVRGKKLGLRVMVFSPEDVDHARRRIRGLFYLPESRSWVRRWSPFPDIVYDRCRNQTNPRFRQLREFRGTYPHLAYLNRPLANKWGVYQTLMQNKDIRPHLPRTARFPGFRKLWKLLRNGRTLYMKPANGTGGRGILRIRRAGSRLSVQGRDRSRRIIQNRLVTITQLTEMLRGWPLEETYMVQQGIDLALPDGRVHDFRLLMQKNENGVWEVTGCAGRVGPPRSITSNLHGGGSAVPMDQLLLRRFSQERVEEIKSAIERLGHNVVRQLEQKYGKLCEMALDIGVDPRGRVFLLEVNPKPSREVFRRIGEKDVYERAVTRPLHYALWVYRQTRKADNKSGE